MSSSAREIEREMLRRKQQRLSLLDAFKEGSWATRLSALLMGFGNVVNGQVLKGLLFLGVQAAYVYYMIASGLNDLAMLPSLGWLKQEEVWNEAKGIFEYTAGHNSVLILLYGVVAVCVTLLFFFVWKAAVKSSYKADLVKRQGKKPLSFTQDIAELFDGRLHHFLLFLPLTGILLFTVLPLIFMISMAFTNYSIVDDHLILFDWVGLENFKTVLSTGNNIGNSFWSVLGWTLTWAIFATGLNYLFGMMLALVINRKNTRAKSFWRFCFVLSVAVPQFVTLLTMRTLLQPQGGINVLLQQAGLTNSALPFLTDATWARVIVIVVNLWVGIPYTLLQVTGILQNIPSDIYEAARIDGAGTVKTFTKITLPYMLFVTAPYLITAFTGNINNFNVIYLLTGGNPTPVNSTAGKTDLLVTWLYKLTIDKQLFNIGAVIGILTFVVLSVVALLTYRNTKSYKDEEGFQ